MDQINWKELLTKNNLQKFFIYAILIVLSSIILLPIYIILVSASQQPEVMSQGMGGLSLIPGNALGLNFYILMSNFNIPRGLINSLVITLTSTVLCAFFSTLTAFALQFYDFKGKKIAMGLMLLVMLAPAQLGLIGYYKICLIYKLIDSYLPLILPSVANVFYVFFIKQYLSSNLHPSFIEAARIDGSNEFYIFLKIVFPLAAPATVVITILSFISSWNDYIRPRILIFSVEKQTLPVILGNLRYAPGGLSSLATIISLIPVIAIFIYASRKVVNNISLGGVKE